MIKMQVNKNINPQVFLVLIFFSLILFAIFFGSLVKMLIATKDYVKTTAEINYIGRTKDSYNYVTVSYKYNNEEYTTNQIVLLKHTKKIGNKYKIYINPENPNETRDNRPFYINILMSIFLLFMHISMIILYVLRKKIT